MSARIQNLFESLNYIEQALQRLDVNPQAGGPAAAPPVNGRISAGSLVVDHLAHRVFIGDRELALPLVEYQILYQLVRRAGLVVQYGDLLRHRHDGRSRSSRHLKAYVGRLRLKLSNAGADRFCRIETVRGSGYRLALQS
ncbi:MAG: winged helix-turn-helix domain-containing protein [Dehalococcoidia bacterium]